MEVMIYTPTQPHFRDNRNLGDALSAIDGSKMRRKYGHCTGLPDHFWRTHLENNFIAPLFCLAHLFVLRTNIGAVSTLDDAVAAFNPTERISGKTVIRVRP